MRSSGSARSPSLPLALLGVAGLALAGMAGAASWKDFSPAFPGLPCPDGWAGCLIGEAVVSPGMVLDGQQRPHPGDMRLGFFDLEPLPAMSPFHSLSPYKVEPPPEPVATGPAATEPTGTQAVAQAEPSGQDDEAAITERLNQEAAQRRMAQAGDPTPQPTANAGRPIDNPTTTARQNPTAELTPTQTPTQTARIDPTPTSTVAPTPTVVPAPTPEPEPEPVARVEPIDNNSCDDLVALEAPAMMGQLGVGRRKCLEARIGTEPSQTNKSKVSRVLMADAEARRDQADWERLIKNHLENIDRSDPSLCFKYAIYLSRGGASKATQVIRWADYALENKQQWSGSTYSKNVYALLKLKTQAANQLWQSAEQDFVNGRKEEDEARATRYRGTTKNFALEWLDYAKASGQDTKAPLAICVSAAGNKEFCEG